MDFKTDRIGEDETRADLDLLERSHLIDAADPLARFRDPAGLLVESEEFFAWAQAVDALRITTKP